MAAFGAVALSVLAKPSNWLWIGAGAMAIIIGVQHLIIQHDSGALKEARAALINPADKHTWQQDALQAEQDLGVCQTNEIQLKGSIAAQNASVAALKAESDQRTAEANKAVLAAHNALAKAQQYASQIASETAGANACDSALNLLRAP